MKNIVVGYRETTWEFRDKVSRVVEEMLNDENGYINDEIYVILEVIKKKTA